jgi:transcriptional regulator of aromatic amino acid metabolism
LLPELDVRMIVRRREPLVTDMHSLEYPWMADAMLVQRLTRSEWRPNLLVLCRHLEPERVVAPLMASAERPCHVCHLPGALTFPEVPGGTLFLVNLGALTLGQQMRLCDWMGDGGRGFQVVSIARESLYPLVEEGRFLEALYYRLNVVSLDAGQSF